MTVRQVGCPVFIYYLRKANSGILILRKICPKYFFHLYERSVTLWCVHVRTRDLLSPRSQNGDVCGELCLCTDLAQPAWSFFFSF